METKNFQSYLEKRLNKKEIKEIEDHALLEIKIIKTIQEGIACAMAEYMSTHAIDCNELAKRLHSNPPYIAKIQKGEANLTVSRIAHILALLGKEPHEVFKQKK